MSAAHNKRFKSFASLTRDGLKLALNQTLYAGDAWMSFSASQFGYWATS